jgi:mannose-6-phosphate isomerase-like protein (cupin superfamily)
MKIEKLRMELRKAYPGCRVKVAADKREMVAEISDKFAVAVIERSMAHFHLKTKEVYRLIRGTLCVARAGKGHVLQVGETIEIEPGQIHYARAVGEPAWVEVETEPPWSVDDHFIL